MHTSLKQAIHLLWGSSCCARLWHSFQMLLQLQTSSFLCRKLPLSLQGKIRPKKPHRNNSEKFLASYCLYRVASVQPVSSPSASLAEEGDESYQTPSFCLGHSGTWEVSGGQQYSWQLQETWPPRKPLSTWLGARATWWRINSTAEWFEMSGDKCVGVPPRSAALSI